MQIISVSGGIRVNPAVVDDVILNGLEFDLPVDNVMLDMEDDHLFIRFTDQVLPDDAVKVEKVLVDFASKYALEPAVIAKSLDGNEPEDLIVGPEGFDPIVTELNMLNDQMEALKAKRDRLVVVNNQKFIPCLFHVVTQLKYGEMTACTEAQLDYTRGIVLEIGLINGKPYNQTSDPILRYEVVAGGETMQLKMGEFGEFYVTEPRKLLQLGSLPQAPFVMSKYAKLKHLERDRALYLADPYTRFRQRATLIAALRHYLDDLVPHKFTQIANDNNHVIQLNDPEIELLIDQIKAGAVL